jgi:hypothetical protein
MTIIAEMKKPRQVGALERETGIEPANLRFGKPTLYQLSYSRVFVFTYYNAFSVDFQGNVLILLSMDIKISKSYIPFLYKEFEEVSPERIIEWYAEVFDRWTWETGTEEDRELLEKLDIEKHYRAKHSKPRKLKAGWVIEDMQDIDAVVGDEAAREIADHIAKEIDAEILRTVGGF